MTRVPKIITIFLALGSLVVLVLILAEGPSRPIAIQKISPVNKIDSLSDSERARVRLPRNPLSFSSTDPTTDNLTESVAFSVAQNILSRDPNGPPLTETELASQILGTPVSFSFDSFLSEITTIKVTTIADPNEADYQRYFDDTIKILERYFSYLKIDFNNLDRAGFQNLARQLDAIIAALMAIPAPNDLATFHEEQLKIISVQKKAFENSADFQTDPLKSMTAVQVIEETGGRLDRLWQSLPKIIEIES